MDGGGSVTCGLLRDSRTKIIGSGKLKFLTDIRMRAVLGIVVKMGSPILLVLYKDGP